MLIVAFLKWLNAILPIAIKIKPIKNARKLKYKCANPDKIATVISEISVDLFGRVTKNKAATAMTAGIKNAPWADVYKQASTNNGAQTIILDDKILLIKAPLGRVFCLREFIAKEKMNKNIMYGVWIQIALHSDILRKAV